MNTILTALIVFGGLIYCIFTLLAYFSESGRRAQSLRGTQSALQQDKKRLSEYSNRIAVLEADLPRRRTRRDRLSQWLGLLRDQYTRLESQQKSGPLNDEKRKETIRQDMMERRRKRGGQ